MEGLYLYCIREKAEDISFSAKGIDGEGEVFILPYQEVEAVVSRISLNQFTSDEIKKRAQEDLNWIKEKALAHERVLEEAMRKNGRVLTLIPIRFGTIFKDRAGLEAILKKDYSKIMEVCERICGKQEWGVKVYLKERKRFEQEIRGKNEEIKAMEREIAALPEGMAYFMEEELKEVISKEAEKVLNNMAGSLFESLEKEAVASIRNKTLEKELTGKGEPMVLNAAYLVPEEKIVDFKKRLDDLNQEIQTEGFYIEHSGPWPPYNFSSY